MLSDLGLHDLVANINAPKQGRQPDNESDLAYALISACIVYEGVWTLYLGRPSSIPRTIMSIATLRLGEKRESDFSWMNAWVALCGPMAQISCVLNEQSANEPNESAGLQTLSQKLEDWYDSLPPDLTYKESRLTNMDLAGYGLHTQYCKIQILLQRSLETPANTRKRRHSEMTSEKSRSTCARNSNTRIYEYAVRIARLIVTYREAFGVEKIPSIMLDNAVVAATAMIEHHHHNSGSVNDQRYQTTWLRQLLKSMETVEPHFPVAGRMLDTLKATCSCGLLDSIFLSARRDSTNARAHELPTYIPPNEPISGSNVIQEDPNAVNANLNFVWDYFDSNASLNVFLPDEFNDVSFDIPRPEIVVSGGRDDGGSL